MKKILFILFLFLSNSFAGFLINNTHCAFKIVSENNSTITLTVYDGNYFTPENKLFFKSQITSFLSGYTCDTPLKANWVRNQQIYKNSFDLTSKVQSENVLSDDSEFMQTLKNSGNIVDNLFLIDSGSSYPSNSVYSNLSCSNGRSLRNSSGNLYNYYSPSGQIINSTTPSTFKAYTNAKFNPDINECFIENDSDSIDVSSFFNVPDSFSTNANFYNHNATISSKINNLVTLIKSSTELPNQNSLENKFEIDTTSSALNCNNSLYSLQEKMLCEMNAGLRKLNQESNPKYSLNNLLSILITSNDKNSEDTNKSIKAISSFEEVRLQKQIETNSLLNETKTNQDLINTNLLKIETTLKGIEDNTKSGIVSGGGSSGGTVTPEPQEIDLDKYFKADETVNNDDLDSLNNETDSLIDSLFSSFTNFKTNIEDSFNTINSQINGLNDVISNPTNIFSKVEIISCPVSYQADFSSFGIGKKTLTVDYCLYTSMLQPIIYFFTYVSLFLGLIFFTFRFIGVLL